MNRVAIFFFYDAQGIVDEYVEVYLRGLKPNLTHLLAVVNGALTDAGRARLQRVADEVLVRENQGFDVWAYKVGIDHIGWEHLAEYDELVLLNHTNFGPVHPFTEMFSEMAERTLDFWGVTQHHGHPFDPYHQCEYGYIPAHIQSSFLVIRRSLLMSEDYRDFWEAMPPISSYEDSICKYEAIFTKTFTDMGYRGEAYVDTSDLMDVTDYPLMTMPTELARNRRCPIFKRKLFFNIYEEFMEATCGQPAVEFRDYLVHETDFDMNLIWDNLLRTANLYDIKQRLQLNYILPRDECAPQTCGGQKVALFAHLYYPDMLQTLLPHMDAMPEDADLFLTTDTEEKAALIRKKMGARRFTLKLIDNRGREYAGFLLAMRDELMAHDIAVILHGKKSHYDKPYLNGDSFLYHCLENTLPTADFVQRVLALFEREPRLGLLVPPTPSHGVYYPTMGREWGGNFANTKQLCETLGVGVPMSESSPPVAPLGGFFWFRTRALKALFDHPWKIEDFPEEPCTAQDGTLMHALERCYPFVAQQAGYYSAWLMSDRFAAMQATNQYKTLRDINQSVGAEHFNLTYFKLLDQLRMMFLQPGYARGFGKRVKMAAKIMMGSENVQRLMLLKGKLAQKLRH